MLRRLVILCRGDAAQIDPWLDAHELRWWLTCVATITIGCALYGGAVGIWRSPEQALYTAIKLPLLIFLTCGANSLLNGLLAQVLGSELGFRQTSLAILMSFTIVALALAALSPVAFFINLNSPPMASTSHFFGHSLILLLTVTFVAYAGVVANHRLLRLLERRCASSGVGRRVFWSWLAGNFFLGAQVSWILRPFIGAPHLTVQFLRDEPLRGNFYETVFDAARSMFL